MDIPVWLYSGLDTVRSILAWIKASITPSDTPEEVIDFDQRDPHITSILLRGRETGERALVTGR